jgi:hypothetical protein
MREGAREAAADELQGRERRRPPHVRAIADEGATASFLALAPDSAKDG